ncbi:putative protein OS=Castellaniella defragrans OX=75697 GN=HNR28_001171 PE=4 SV=1 [Castellaniella denitrificans]|uniref:hypothetical protein n=1 Tax=Castellaniella sp. TaxID=1955812 RepID=UPI002AFE8E41|nr:hypothetical protein [Castellaniella sp.]
MIPASAPIKRAAMFFHSNLLLVLFILGIIAMFIGFGFRDRNPGIILLGTGFLVALFVIIRKAVDVFG